MNNTVDFFQPEYRDLALPAATTKVFVEGVLCEDLEPIEIVRASWPDFGYAKLCYRPVVGCDVDLMPYEDVADRFAMGQTVRVCQFCDGASPAGVAFSVPIFVGQIEGVEIGVGAENDVCEITAFDYGAVMRRITVYGRHVLADDGSIQCLAGLDTTFNPAGRGNAAVSTVSLEGKTHTPFCSGDANAAPWDYASAIVYLLSTYLPSGSLHWPDPDRLRALTGSRFIRDLDVTGLSLVDALHRCCEDVGLEFRFVPRLAETGPIQAIVFYRNGQGRSVELNCQAKGQPLNLSRTNVSAFQSRRSFHPVTHRYVGQGDFKAYEATFELIKAWDSNLDDTDFAKFSPTTNSQFHAVKDVYRKWCLNEAGGYTSLPYNCGEPFDFISLFEGANFLHRRRRFWPALSADTQGQSFGYFLEVSHDDGLEWRQYLHAFNNLTDECGIWLSSDALDIETWVAALKGALRFRITATVIGDERLTCIAANGPVGSTIPVVDHVITLPRQFRYTKVSPGSVLAQADPTTLGAPATVDDTDALYEHVRWQAEVSTPVIERAEAHTASLALDFHPGDRVTSCPDDRDLLGMRRDNRSRAWIERVEMDFMTQQTRLQIVRGRPW